MIDEALEVSFHNSFPQLDQVDVLTLPVPSSCLGPSSLSLFLPESGAKLEYVAVRPAKPVGLVN